MYAATGGESCHEFPPWYVATDVAQDVIRWLTLALEAAGLSGPPSIDCGVKPFRKVCYRIAAEPFQRNTVQDTTVLLIRVSWRESGECANCGCPHA